MARSLRFFHASAAEILQKAGKILFRIQGKALLHQLLVIFPQGGKTDIGYLRRGIRAVGIDAQDTIFCPDKVQRLGICLLLCGNGIGNRYGIRTEGKLLVYQKGKQKMKSKAIRTNAMRLLDTQK